MLINQKPHRFPAAHLGGDIRSRRRPDDYRMKVVREPDPGQLRSTTPLCRRLEAKNGDRFRVVPPGTFGDPGGLPQQLVHDVETIRERGPAVSMIEADGLAYLVLDEFPLPRGYNKASTRLMLKVPLSYPNGNPDMFWIYADVRLAAVTPPANTNQESALGAAWLRFSWHPQKWNPGSDDIATYLDFVETRLALAK